MQLIFYWCYWSIITRDWKYICYVWLSKGAIVHPLMLLNVNTYANSVIESSFAFMNFIEVLMNVYLPYSFNCWRKWMFILCKWTAKGVVYFTRVVTNERKFSWRWNILAKLLQGMKNNFRKNESKIIFRCLVRALWKCTESPIEIMQIRYVLADFELSYFFPK